MPADLLVRLYDMEEDRSLLEQLEAQGIKLRRVLPPDMHLLREFCIQNFSEGWADECTASILKDGCFMAVKDQRVLGFACVEAMPDYFGPTGVLESERGKGIGKALLLKSLLALRERGYAYAVIGCVDDALGFYEKTCRAITIPDSFPGHYGNLARFN